MIDQNEVIVNPEEEVNDKFGKNPWYDVGSYDGFARRKCILPNQNFLSDKEIYDDVAHKATAISVESATGNKIEVNGEMSLIINPTPANSNVPECVWESSESSVAYVKDGVVVGTCLGTTEITVTDGYDASVTTSYTVNVVENVEKAWQEENTQTITEELTEQGGGDVVITTGTVAEINIPSSITKTSSVTAPLADNTTYTSESTKSVTINNTSETPSNISITSGASTVNLTGQYDTVESNTSIKGTNGTIKSVQITEDASKTVSVNAVFAKDCSVVNPTEQGINIRNGNASAGGVDPNLTINSPESTVNLYNDWNTVYSTTGDNTLVVGPTAHIYKLVVKKGNVVVNDTKVENRIDEVVNDTEYTITPRTKDCSTWSEFKSSASTNGITNLTADISTTSGVTLGILATGNYEWNLADKNIETTSSSLFLVKGLNVNLTINSDGGNIKSGGYAFWLSSVNSVVNIYGGNWEANTHAIYAENGVINIYGGIFSVTGEDKRYVLNCYDASYTSGKAKIIVYGGRYIDFDPANSIGEPGGPVSFVAPGYESVQVEENVWEVRAINE